MLLHLCAVLVVSMCLNLQYLRNRFDKGLNTFASKGFNSTPHKIKTPWQEKMNYLSKLNIYNETFFFYLRFFFFTFHSFWKSKSTDWYYDFDFIIKTILELLMDTRYDDQCFQNGEMITFANQNVHTHKKKKYSTYLKLLKKSIPQ